MDDDAHFLRAGGHAYVEIGAVAVSARYLNRAAAVVAGILRCVVEGVDGPPAVVAVRPVVVNADMPAGMAGSVCAAMDGSRPSSRNANATHRQTLR